MDSQTIRISFLKFFKGKGHSIKKAAPLIPEDDPTLLFTGAGMNQFKKEFLGIGDEKLKRATTCQKCLRTSDIDIIGESPFHHTFFEMLGNFSFGDYFKEEVISWAWEFIREIFKLQEKTLWITIYEDDEEAYRIWNKSIGIKEERIVPLDKDYNWWDMDVTGPCGPCSEIIVDRGENLGCGKETCGVTCGCGRFLELWNLVFTQFDRKRDGSLQPLPQKNIDTGMGLERASLIMQKKDDNFQTDLFYPLLKRICEMTKVKYEGSNIKPMRIVSDHIRAISFLICDGVFPSNEGRGYVLRRITRRGLRQGEKLKIKTPFLYKLVPEVVRMMENAYPDLKERIEYIIQVLKSEEASYKRTLEEGLKILDEIFKAQKEKGELTISGRDIFRLYDTHGFPVELIEEIAKEKGFNIDGLEFRSQMDSQKERGRLSWAKSLEGKLSPSGRLSWGKNEKKIVETSRIYSLLKEKFGRAEFIGYENLKCATKILSIIKDGEEEKGKTEKGEEFEFLTPITPFYAEGGGQVTDKGYFKTEKAGGRVDAVYYKDEELIIHRAILDEGELKKGEDVHLVVNKERRKNISRHHTTTHLLQYALRSILGTHIQQSGSLVDESYFRFDFSHFSALAQEQLEKVEGLVNEKIRDNLSVETENVKLDEVKKKEGVLSFFGEKYGEIVRIVSIGDISKELCGGTHTKNTGEIGLFHIMNESSIGGGLRRIEAVSGEPAYDKIKENLHTLKKTSFLLKSSPDELDKRIEELLKERKCLLKELERLKEELVVQKIEELLKTTKTIKGVKIIRARIDGVEREGLRRLLDMLKERMKTSSMIIIAGAKDGRGILIGGLTKDLEEKGLHMGKIIKEITETVGGSGGGRRDFAEGGVREIKELSKALDGLEELVEKIMVKD